MKNKQRFSVPPVGGSSLLASFAVLCLAILSLLTLNTVLSERRISEREAQNTLDWYKADLYAQEIFAELRTGQQAAGVQCFENQYHYTVPISEFRSLQVILQKNSDSWEVITWQTMSHPETGNTLLPVWQGIEEE